MLHVSSAGGVELVRRAKERGLNVTAETAPHYLALTDESLAGLRHEPQDEPAALRTAEDRDALRRGVAEGVLDAIATDHAPHPVHEKDAEFDRAPFGVLGLETALGVLLTHLVRPGTPDARDRGRTPHRPDRPAMLGRAARRDSRRGARVL